MDEVEEDGGRGQEDDDDEDSEAWMTHAGPLES